jgi:hypothetical protein
MWGANDDDASTLAAAFQFWRWRKLWRVVMRHFNDTLELRPRVIPAGGSEAAAALGAAGVDALTAACDSFGVTVQT